MINLKTIAKVVIFRGINKEKGIFLGLLFHKSLKISKMSGAGGSIPLVQGGVLWCICH